MMNQSPLLVVIVTFVAVPKMRYCTHQKDIHHGQAFNAAFKTPLKMPTSYSSFKSQLCLLFQHPANVYSGKTTGDDSNTWPSIWESRLSLRIWPQLSSVLAAGICGVNHWIGNVCLSIFLSLLVFVFQTSILKKKRNQGTLPFDGLPEWTFKMKRKGKLSSFANCVRQNHLAIPGSWQTLCFIDRTGRQQRVSFYFLKNVIFGLIVKIQGGA